METKGLILHMYLPYFPPSLNRAYFGKEKRLSTESRNFKANGKIHLSQTYLEEIGAFIKNHENNKSHYTLVIRLHSSWIAKNGNPLKQDISNYLKLVEDVVSEVANIDDKHNFRVVLDKVNTEQTPFVEIYLYKQENEGLLNEGNNKPTA